MQEHDLAGPIMKKIAVYENTRIRRWSRLFLIGVACLAVLFSVCIYFVTQSFFDEEVKSMLLLYTSDREMFIGIWREAMSFVWDVVPHWAVYMSVGTAFLFVVLYAVTRVKRQVIGKRKKELRSYLGKT